MKNTVKVFEDQKSISNRDEEIKLTQESLISYLTASHYEKGVI